MTSINKEFLLYILKNPHFIPASVSFYCKGVKREIDRRFNKERWDIDNFPPPIRKMVKALSKSSLTPEIRRDINLPYSTKRCVSMSGNLPQNTLKLATGLYDFAGFPEWEKCFEDCEQTESLHRWNWLMFKLVEEPTENVPLWGINLMMDWFNKMQHTRNSIAWD